MAETRVEHVNLTVSDPEATAAWLCAVFGWKIRWQGGSIYDGRSIHVGGENSYLALYSPQKPLAESVNTYETVNGLNHLAFVVDDLDATEDKVKKAGFTPRSHADYEPGRRFYFEDHDGVEYEIVQYD